MHLMILHFKKYTMTKLLGTQEIILNNAKLNDNKISRKDAVDLAGHRYDYNAKKRVGHAMERLVKDGLMIRVKMGHYEINKSSPDF